MASTLTDEPPQNLTAEEEQILERTKISLSFISDHKPGHHKDLNTVVQELEGYFKQLQDRMLLVRNHASNLF